MTRGAKVKVGAVVLGLIAASFIVLPLGFLPLPSMDEPPASAPAETSAPLPPPPPCIREHCFERPRYLRCTVWGTAGNAPCAVFEINYEAHCDCVEWGVRPADGGPDGQPGGGR